MAISSNRIFGRGFGGKNNFVNRMKFWRSSSVPRRSRGSSGERVFSVFVCLARGETDVSRTSATRTSRSIQWIRIPKTDSSWISLYRSTFALFFFVFWVRSRTTISGDEVSEVESFKYSGVRRTKERGGAGGPSGEKRLVFRAIREFRRDRTVSSYKSVVTRENALGRCSGHVIMKGENPENL